LEIELMEIPNILVKDAADQFKKACMAVNEVEEGLVLPLINLATVAIELYLKSLSADEVRTPIDSGSSCVEELYAKAKSVGGNGHGLMKRLEVIPEAFQKRLISAYKAEFGGCIKAVLSQFEGAFQASRYPYEKGNDFGNFTIDDLINMTNFLSHFVELESN